jgi:Raf kinase inhibitor-like YbhB/YbcL family protein
MIANTLIRAATFLTTASIAAGPAEAQFRLTSRDFQPGGTIHEEQVYNDSGCTGQNVSPDLRWSGAPANTKSFALLLYDPDAPTGGAGWWHWVVYDIPAGTTELRKGAGNRDGSTLPPGAASVANDYGAPGYGGPCPPAGDKPHRYVFTVYALKVDRLGVPKDARASVAGFMVNANAIGKATVTGMYGRAKR